MTNSEIEAVSSAPVNKTELAPQRKKAFMLLTVSAPRNRRNYNEHAVLAKLSRQREALRRKATELDVYIAGEVIIEKRPGWADGSAFRYLLRTIQEERIDFVLIYPVSLHRSYAQDAITRAAIGKAGAELVSYQAGRIASMTLTDEMLDVADWLNHAHQTQNAA
jgi:hypothetical protein